MTETRSETPPSGVDRVYDRLAEALLAAFACVLLTGLLAAGLAVSTLAGLANGEYALGAAYACALYVAVTCAMAVAMNRRVARWCAGQTEDGMP